MSVEPTDWLLNPDDPDQLVPVPAGELFEWAWLVAEVADWLDHAAQTTRFDLHRYFHAQRSPQTTAASLAQIRARIGALLDPEPRRRP